MGKHNPDPRAGDGDHRFPRKFRLRTAAEFAQVYKHQRPVSDEVLLVFFRPNELGHARLGLSVSRKVGNAARRNRWKRLIRETFRRMKSEMTVSVDLIVIPRGLDAPTFAAVQSSLSGLVRRVERRLNKDRGRCD